MSIASNPGHLLWSGIVPPDRARRVVHRLLKPDMMSGWGVRTLSSAHPAFNPYSYQNGAVWPHDNALIAAGFRRYGYDDEANLLMRDMLQAASHFMQHQVPELYSGLQRDATGFPVQYLGANVPQAWAAGACFAFLQTLLGFAPDGPRGRLYLDPCLPEWMPRLTLADMRLGSGKFDIAFQRDGDVTRFEVLKGDPRAVEQKNYASQADRWL
jgi:glycogen debranching enzyme